MPKRSRKQPKPDLNQIAARIVAQSTGQPIPAPEISQPEKNPAAVALGRLGGQKGGPARAAALSKTRRIEIARKAARAKWLKRNG